MQVVLSPQSLTRNILLDTFPSEVSWCSLILSTINTSLNFEDVWPTHYNYRNTYILVKLYPHKTNHLCPISGWCRQYTKQEVDHCGSQEIVYICNWLVDPWKQWIQLLTTTKHDKVYYACRWLLYIKITKKLWETWTPSFMIVYYGA